MFGSVKLFSLPFVTCNMIRVVLFLVVVVQLACSKTADTAAAPNIIIPPVITPPVSNSTKTYLALGDSYTIGQGVDPTERFPAQTVNWLKTNGVIINSPNYIATTGWTTTYLQNAINTQNPANFDVVTLLIGVNDQYQTHDTTGYRQRFTTLLIKAIEIAKGKKENVVVLSIPDYSVTPFAEYGDTSRIRQEIDWFNAINKSVTTAVNCPYLDITPSTREARYDRSLVAGDGLHPSGSEYRRWAYRLGPILLPLLK
jgi:lysophospholipase L1-like esterase